MASSTVTKETRTSAITEASRPNDKRTVFHEVSLSLSDVLGQDYVGAACEARAFLTGECQDELLAMAAEKVSFYPQAFHERLTALLPHVGEACCAAPRECAAGATSNAFRANSRLSSSPLSCLGYLRLAADGRLCLTSKSEHYHAPLGHCFPGYSLIERAHRLGIPNATHNNTRGHITRLVEEELVRCAAGIPRGDRAALDATLASRDPSVLNRVLNLETGSLAAEAAVKMLLSRFYRVQQDAPEPRYAGRTPVLLVIGDEDGGLRANYHGTTVLTQLMRGMWPEILAGFEEQGLLMVRSVRRDSFEELESVFGEYEQGPCKIAGFFHELLLMNHGAKQLSEAFVKRLYALCEQHDVPTVVDEIQTCVWSPEIFMYREYGVKPSILILGKGFPGGEYAASRVLFSAAMDSLPQFGALVTNGQEELASLAYLVTLRWAEANADVTSAVGAYYEGKLHALAETYPHLITSIEGKRHSTGVYFVDLDAAKAFVGHLDDAGLDISAQTYKEGCPPSALTKLPLTSGYEVVDAVIARMNRALQRI